ncbi:MAG: hypothetical protein IMZ55_17895 [Acidobacteria bacterium]|nr:hypothetical protein [Acidobacteriota bacterium]
MSLHQARIDTTSAGLAVANFAQVSISLRLRSFATMLVCRDAREQMPVQLQLVEVVAATLA